MPPFLYIDPGTGSMLFSVIIGLATTGYFVLKSLFVKLRFRLSGKPVAAADGRRHPYVIYCEGPQYWNVFRPVVDEFERRGIPLRYLTSSENDPVLAAGLKSVSGEYIGAGNRAFARLNMLECDVCLMTTPGLDVYQLKRSRGVGHYSHLLHSVDDVTGYRLFGIDYYDSILLSGEYQKDHVRRLESQRGLPAKDLVVVGSTYLDVLAERAKTIAPEANRPFTVLVAPSWGQGAILTRYGERLLDPLVASGYRVIVRPHPQSRTSEAQTLKALEERYRDKANVEWDYDRDNAVSLSRADVMISDFSSVIFDYCFIFDRPFVFANQDFDLRPYDASDIDEKPWKFRVLGEIGVPLRESDFARIKDVVDGAAASAPLRDARALARDVAWQHRGESASRIVDYLVAKRADLVAPQGTAR